MKFKQCPNCDNTGIIPVQIGHNEWEPMQCEFCYCDPESIFNHTSGEEILMKELLKLRTKYEI